MRRLFLWLVGVEILVLQGYDRGGAGPPLSPLLLSPNGFYNYKFLLQTVKYFTGSCLRNIIPFHFIVELSKLELQTGGPYRLFKGEFNVITNIFIHITLKSNFIENDVLANWVNLKIDEILASGKFSNLLLIQILIYFGFEKDLNRFQVLNSILMSNYKVIVSMDDLLEFNFEKLIDSLNDLKPLKKYVAYKNKSDALKYYEETSEIIKSKLSGIINIPELLNNSFTFEVIMSPFHLSKYLSHTHHRVDDSTLQKISCIGVLAWILFASLDDMQDGHNTFTMSVKKLLAVRKLFLADLYNVTKNTNIREKILSSFSHMENGPIITERDVIERSSIYYLVYPLSGIRFRPNVIKGIKLYLLAKQYMDDIVDFEDDIRLGRNTLLSSKYNSLVDLKVELPFILTRIRNLTNEAMLFIPSYPPLDALVGSMNSLSISKS